MAATSLVNVGAAKDLFQRQFALTDQRVQRQIRPVLDKIVGEYSLQAGADDEINGIVAGTRFTMCAPWDGDVRQMRIWCAAPLPPVVDPTAPPPVVPVVPVVPLPPAVTLSFEVAHRLTPLVLLPMSTAVAGYSTVLQYLELADTTAVSETDTSGGANVPALGNNLLSLSGFSPALQQGDMIYVTVMLATNVALLGVELLCVLRPASIVVPVIGP